MKKFRCIKTKRDGKYIDFTEGAYYYEPDAHMLNWQEFSTDLPCVINNHGEQIYWPAHVFAEHFVEVTESNILPEPMLRDIDIAIIVTAITLVFIAVGSYFAFLY